MLGGYVIRLAAAAKPTTTSAADPATTPSWGSPVSRVATPQPSPDHHSLVSIERGREEARSHSRDPRVRPIAANAAPSVFLKTPAHAALRAGPDSGPMTEQQPWDASTLAHLRQQA
jgi:hypothetical protein